MGLSKRQLDEGRGRRKKRAEPDLSGGSRTGSEVFYPASPRSSAESQSESVLRSLMFGFPDGGVRTVSLEDEQKVFLFFKWSRGQFAGHYVVWVTHEYDDLGLALAGLLNLVEKVYEGKRKPTKDKKFS